MISLSEIIDEAKTEASRRGFRSLGIYHLLWAVHKLDPDTMDSWLERYQVERAHFIKMLENVLRPRRAGGGVPRDRYDAALLEDAISRATQLDDQPNVQHFFQVLRDLEEDPIISLCERFGLPHQTPK